MPEIKIFGSSCRLEEGENLLEGLLKQGVRIPHSCRAGVCHSCLLRLEKGQPPAGSQDTLTHQQIQQHYILACQSQVSGNLHIGMIQRDQMPATIIAIQQVTPTCLSLALSPRFPISSDNNNRLIALDLTPEVSGKCQIHRIDNENNTLIIQIDRKAGDAFSSWIHENAATGDQMILRLL